jgi:hypothetical protein
MVIKKKSGSLTIVVWLLKFVTNACKLLKQVFNHLPGGGGGGGFLFFLKNGTLV